MPHDPSDQRYPHLPLVAEEGNPDRRKRPAPPPPPPDRGGRSKFAGTVRDRLDDIEEELNERPLPPAGIQPHLVFRVPLAAKASPVQMIDMLERIGIAVVSIESDNAIIAFRNEVDLTSFRDAVTTYEQGPRIDQKTGQPFKSTQFDVLEYIETAQMRLWGREDRIGPCLASMIGDDGKSISPRENFYVDVELWHRGSDDLARVGIEELKLLISAANNQNERICDTFRGQLLCLARVAVTGTTLSRILDLDIVAEAELPPEPTFDHRQAKFAREQNFPTPPAPEPGGPSVCVVDSGATSNHPLIANNFGHAEAILTGTETTADEHGHGTMVGGLAVFGSIRACYSSGEFASPVTLYSARVLNSKNRFDDETLVVHQMRRAIDVFMAAPYSCRVFNLSLGSRDAWLRDNDRQSLWAESLDVLAREYNVLLVVSAGNQDFGLGYSPEESEEIIATYPEYLFRADCGLCEPATAAIAIAVGGVAEFDSPTIRAGQAKDDINLGIAKPFQPSPLTRIGPGVNGAIKPEFVAPSGNTSFQGYMQMRTVGPDPGMSVMSLSNEPANQLFAYDTGTSLAAPIISRSAAILWNHLQDQIGEEPQANLVRAVLAASAQVPSQIKDLLHDEHGEAGLRQVCGYGMVDDDFALRSGDRRVTLLHQSNMALDTFSIFEVPIPDEFREAKGKKHVTVSLAFDPPVRRRRAEYLGVRMSYWLVRGKSVEDIVEAYRQLTEEERKAATDAGESVQGAFKSPFKCDLKPGPQTLQSSALQQSRWSFSSSRPDYGDSYYLVVRADRRWAPDTFTHQDYAVSVTLQADEPQLYNLIRNRVRVRQQQRARARG